MNVLTPLARIIGSTFVIVSSIWIASRMIRWARKGSKGTDLLGLGMTTKRLNGTSVGAE
jgi:hypothetical protein